MFVTSKDVFLNYLNTEAPMTPQAGHITAT